MELLDGGLREGVKSVIADLTSAEPHFLQSW
jgi:hypothetical protein